MAIKPAMRKVPKQGRSRMLVDSVKETCRRILCHELDAPLTTTEVARLSGIAVGSLYQYFPDIESVVASVYDDMAFESVTGQHEFAVNQLAEMPLQDGLGHIIEAAVHFHCKMLELNPDFHRQYHACFDLNECFNRLADERDTTWIVSQLIASEQPHLTEAETTLVAALMIEVMVTSINTVIQKCPERLSDPGFHKRLLNMSLGLLDTG